MEWIKTSEQLPPRVEGAEYSNPQVLTYSHGEYAILCFNHEHECWDDESGDDYECDIEEIEWWQPLPKSPENNE